MTTARAASSIRDPILFQRNTGKPRKFVAYSRFCPRKRGIVRVILAGMSANLCTEAHPRELLEQGFDVTVISDGTAAAKLPAGDGYAAAITNFRFLANGVLTTKEVVKAM